MGGGRPLPTKCWMAFLTYMGFSEARKEGTHHHWKKAGVLRTITFWGHLKEVPFLHLKTCCRSIGCNLSDLYDWAEVNC